jgi:N utilization substance protein B
MGMRHKAREYALHGLYMYDTVKASIDDILSLSWADEAIPDDSKAFFVTIVRGTIEHLDTIDEMIKKHCLNWSFERIAAVDKAILRISVYGMLFQKDLPMAVTIDEGIELGKKFGGDGSGHFINGILDGINKQECESK